MKSAEKIEILLTINELYQLADLQGCILGRLLGQFAAYGHLGC